MKISRIGAMALFAALGLFGIAFAQTIVPQVVAVQTADLFADVVNGVPGVPTNFATAGQINGQFGAQRQSPLTGFTITVANNVPALLLTPAATIAAGTLNLPAAPVDQQVFRFLTTQIVTALVVAAPAGQTVGGTALTQPAINTVYTWIYYQPSNTWQRLTQG